MPLEIHGRPVLPSYAAHITHQLALVVHDLVAHEVSAGTLARRDYLKLCGLAAAMEVFSREAASWYGQLEGEDHDLLEGLEERFAGRGLQRVG